MARHEDPSCWLQKLSPESRALYKKICSDASPPTEIRVRTNSEPQHHKSSKAPADLSASSNRDLGVDSRLPKLEATLWHTQRVRSKLFGHSTPQRKLSGAGSSALRSSSMPDLVTSSSAGWKKKRKKKLLVPKVNEGHDRNRGPRLRLRENPAAVKVGETISEGERLPQAQRSAPAEGGSILALFASFDAKLDAFVTNTTSISSALEDARAWESEIVSQISGLEDQLTVAASKRDSAFVEAEGAEERLRGVEREVEMSLQPLTGMRQQLAESLAQQVPQYDEIHTVQSTKIPGMNAIQVAYELQPSDSCLSSYVSKNLPVVLGNIRSTSAWPLHNGVDWKDGYLRSVAGHRHITVRLPNAKSSDANSSSYGTVFGDPAAEGMYSTEAMSLTAYLQLLSHNACQMLGLRYAGRLLLQKELPELLKDVQRPEETSFAQSFGRAYEEGVISYFGSCRQTTPLHFDKQEILIFVVRGSKEFLLWPPSDSDCLYPGEWPKGLYSRVRPWRAEETKRCFPRFLKTRPFACTVNEGEALYLPFGWWHLVTGSEGVNLTLNYCYDLHPSKSA